MVEKNGSSSESTIFVPLCEPKKRMMQHRGNTKGYISDAYLLILETPVVGKLAEPSFAETGIIQNFKEPF